MKERVEGDQALVTAAPTQLTAWWKETAELERAIGYRFASQCGRAMWDDLLTRLVLQPTPELYEELRICIFLWGPHPLSAVPPRPVLDLLAEIAVKESLRWPEQALTAATQLRQRLQQRPPSTSE